MISRIIKLKFFPLSCPSYRFTNAADYMFQQKEYLQTEKERAEELRNMKSKKPGVIKKKKRYLPSTLDVKIPEMNPPKDVHYAYESEGIIKVPRQVYIPPIKKGYKRFLQKQEYQKFLAEALKTNTGEQTILEQSEEIDELWEGSLPIKLYSKISSKDLFYNYREPDYIKFIDRKNNHQKWLCKPYKIHNGNITSLITQIHKLSENEIQKVYNPNYFIEEDFYVKNEEVAKLFEQLNKEISNVSYIELPQIALTLAFDLKYKIDVFKIWENIESILTSHTHHYNIQQLCQLKYAFAGTYPKACSSKLHNQIYQIVDSELDTLNPEELMNVLGAFRSISNELLSDKIINKLKDAKIEDPDLLAAVFYSIQNNQPKKHQRVQNIDYDNDLKKRKQLMEKFTETLKQNISRMTLDSLTRLSVALTLVRLPNYDDVFLHIEQSVIQQSDKIDEVHVSQILYAFSKGNNGLSVGSVDFYQKLSPAIRRLWSKIGNLSKSRIYYAYCNHRVIIQKDQNELFLPWIKENTNNFSLAELQNVVYGLMYTQNSDKEIWKGIVRNIGYQKEIVPLANHYALKQAFHYVEMFFPNWNLKPFLDALYEAENLFSVLRLQRVSEEDKDMFITLQSHFDYNWNNFHSFDNLYLLGNVLKEQRIALLIQTFRLSLPNGETRPQLLLQQQLIESQEWKAPILNYEQMMSMNVDQRKLYLDETIKGAIEDQKPKFQRWEQERRNQIYSKLLQIGKEITTPGLQVIEEDAYEALNRKVQ